MGIKSVARQRSRVQSEANERRNPPLPPRLASLSLLTGGSQEVKNAPIRVSHRGNSSSPGLISHASVELHSPGCTLLTSGIATCDIDLKSGMGTLPIISRFRFVCEPFRCLQFSHQAGAFDVAPREVWIVREHIFYVWHTPDDIPY